MARVSQTDKIARAYKKARKAEMAKMAKMAKWPKLPKVAKKQACSKNPVTPN